VPVAVLTKFAEIDDRPWRVRSPTGRKSPGVDVGHTIDNSDFVHNLQRSNVLPRAHFIIVILISDAVVCAPGTLIR
jgi:hypothetical protein